MAMRTLWEKTALHALARPPDWLGILSLHRLAGTVSIVAKQTSQRLTTQNNAPGQHRQCRPQLWISR